MTETTTRPVVDLLAPELYVDLDAMHAAFTWMRHHEPVFRDEANGLWAVTRHADVLDVEHRSDVFVSGRGYRSFHSPGEDNMIAQDDPAHLEQRRLIARRFTPKAVRELEPVIRRIITDLLDEALPSGRMDVVGQLAAPLPARLTAHLLGFPEDTWPRIRTWSERLRRYDQLPRDAEVAMSFIGAIGEFDEVLTDVAEQRRRVPADDLVSVWVQSELQGCPMSHETLINETGLVISGGAETTRTVIARGLLALADAPEQWDAMSADPSLVTGAVEELIRWVTPLNNFFRTAAAEDRIGAQEVREGDRVVLLYPSANRDEAVFDEPFRFDIRRKANPHVAFGFGSHFCLGASLARLELRLLFEELTRRITDLEVLAPPELEANIFVTAVQSLQLGFTTR
jgi:cholest-4-en-3-one 26-monooxygenase